MPDDLQRRASFASLIRNTTGNPAHRDSVIADAVVQCRYPDVPAHLDALQRVLSARGVEPHECITLELSNSVPSALTLLALLERGNSVLPTPAAGRGARAKGRSFAAPRFARWLLVIDAARQPEGIVPGDPASWLTVAANDGHDPAAALDDPGPWLLLRTSGSLGAPRLVKHRHEKLLAQIMHCRDRLSFAPEHRLALPVPLFHMFGLAAGFLPALAGGASIDLQERANLMRYLEREDVFDPNIAFMTPSFCETLVRVRKSQRPYTFMVSAGDRIGEATCQRSEDKHGPLLNAYGSTEMGLTFCAEPGMPPALRRTVGRALPGVEYRIVDNLDADPEPGVGSLQLRHEHGFEGYINLDGAPVIPDGAFDGDWFCSRDVARIGSEGCIEILGRMDLSINRSGMLLTFADVEALLREIDGVDEAGVAAGAQGLRGRALVAFCTLRDKDAMSVAALKARFDRRAPAFARPDHWHILPALPKLASGKLDRAQLAALAEQHTDATPVAGAKAPPAEAADAGRQEQGQ